MIQQLMESLNMKGALKALDKLNGIVERDAFLTALLQAEYEDRATRANKRRLSNAKFPVDKEWAEINPALNPTIRFQDVQALRDSHFVSKCTNLCLIGEQGTGKTHSLIALGRDLCRKGVAVKFYTACELVTILEEAKIQCTLRKVMNNLTKPALLIIDELGYVPFSESGSRLLFDVFSNRYERGSIAVSTNLAFDKWVTVFGSVELTGALLDRFTHNAHVFPYRGPSVRFMQAKHQKEAATAKVNKEKEGGRN